MSKTFPGSDSPAFTLVELMVVTGVIAILGCLLLPALAATTTRDKSQRITCLNNNRQLGLALQMYAHDNQDLLPWPNWGNVVGTAPPGWLYAGSPPATVSLAQYNVIGPTKFETLLRLPAIKGGMFYQYVLNTSAFRCPLDQPGSTNTSWGTREQQLSSYVMNPSGAFSDPNLDSYGSQDGYKTVKITQIWSPDCIILWEQSYLPGQGDWSDGSNLPDQANQGGTAHINGGIVLTIGGQAKWMSQTNFVQAAVDPPAGTQNLLWWNPSH